MSWIYKYVQRGRVQICERKKNKYVQIQICENSNMCKYKYVKTQICRNTNMWKKEKMCKYKYVQKRGCAARIGRAVWRVSPACLPLLVAVDWQEEMTQIVRWGAQFPSLSFIVFHPSGSGMAAENSSCQSLPCSNFALAAKFQIPETKFQIHDQGCVLWIWCLNTQMLLNNVFHGCLSCMIVCNDLGRRKNCVCGCMLIFCFYSFFFYI